jgi:hypothetical protein
MAVLQVEHPVCAALHEQARAPAPGTPSKPLDPISNRHFSTTDIICLHSRKLQPLPRLSLCAVRICQDVSQCAMVLLRAGVLMGFMQQRHQWTR